MLHTPKLSRLDFTYDNYGANPSATPGTSVTPGTSNAEGSWTQVAAHANLTSHIYGFYVRVSDGLLSSQKKDHLLDIGVDPAGGTAYQAIISNICCGSSSSIAVGGPFQYLFPMYIPSGSSVAVRVQGNNVVAGTLRVAIKFYGSQSRPEMFPVGYFSETIGSFVASSGTLYTPGNAADGTWTLLGATSKDLWWWQLTHQRSNQTQTAEITYHELGFGDGSNKHIIMKLQDASSTAEQSREVFHSNLNIMECYCPLPSGTNIYVRGRCSAAPDFGYCALAVGIGG